MVCQFKGINKISSLLFVTSELSKAVYPAVFFYNYFRLDVRGFSILQSDCLAILRLRFSENLSSMIAGCLRIKRRETKVQE